MHGFILCDDISHLLECNYISWRSNSSINKNYETIYKNSNYFDFLIFNIIFYLIIRSFFEDTLAFTSIDLILFMSCFISILVKISRLNKDSK